MDEIDEKKNLERFLNWCKWLIYSVMDGDFAGIQKTFV